MKRVRGRVKEEEMEGGGSGKQRNCFLFLRTNMIW